MDKDSGWLQVRWRCNDGCVGEVNPEARAASGGFGRLRVASGVRVFGFRLAGSAFGGNRAAKGLLEGRFGVKSFWGEVVLG